MTGDPTQTDPDLYRVVFENDRVRVLGYRDQPGDRTSAHHHPDSVMYTLSAFRRRISTADQQVEVELPAGQVRWLDALGACRGEHRCHSHARAVRRAQAGTSRRPGRGAGARPDRVAVARCRVSCVAGTAPW
jgi:hypothetical protein